MHEIRATLPAEHVGTAARLAHEAGIPNVAVSDVYLHGPEEGRKIVSVETSTPKARDFVDALLGAASLRGVDYSLTSRELRAIVSGEDILDITRPMSDPFRTLSRWDEKAGLQTGCDKLPKIRTRSAKETGCEKD